MRSSSSSVASSARPCDGPRTIATAMARLSVTIGPGSIRCRRSYSARTCAQSVAEVLGASSWTAAMAASSWYGPTGPLVSAPDTSATPSAISSWSHLAAILLAERDQLSVVGGPGRPASVGQQHQRQQAGDLTVAGEAAGQLPSEADRFRRQLRPLEVVAAAGGVPLVEHQVQDAQHRLEPFGPLRGGRQLERDGRLPDALLGAADALGHGGFGGEERAGDLRRGQPPDGAQRECDL